MTCEDPIFLKNNENPEFVLILNKIKCEFHEQFSVSEKKMEQTLKSIFQGCILTQGTWS